MSNNRDTKIDLFKGICILCIVLGHSGAPFTKYIYLFHVAAFFVASGYTYTGENVKIYEYVKKKFFNIILPCVVVNSIYICMYYFLQLLGLFQYIDDAETFVINSAVRQLLHYGTSNGVGGATWFLPTLFWSNVIYKLIDSKMNKQILVYLGSTVCMVMGWICIKNGYIHYWYLDLGLFAVGFCAFGNWLAKKELMEKIDTKYFLPMCFLGTAFFGEYYYTITTTWPSRIFDRSLILQVISTLLAMYCCWMIVLVIDKTSFIKKFILCLSQHSYTILILHFTSFKFISLALWAMRMENIDCMKSLTPMSSLSGYKWLYYAFGAILICILTSDLAKKNKVSNYIINAKIKVK